MWIFVVGANASLWCVSPPAGPTKLTLSSPESTFPRIWSSSESWQNLSPLRNFAQGIESRQQMHSWIACYPTNGGKFLRSDFFLGIHVIFAFLWSIYPTFWQPNWGQISPDDRITLRAGRALRVIWIFVVVANAPLWCVSPRQGPKNWPKAHQKALFPKFDQFRSHDKIFPHLGISPKE